MDLNRKGRIDKRLRAARHQFEMILNEELGLTDTKELQAIVSQHSTAVKMLEQTLHEAYPTHIEDIIGHDKTA